MKRRFGARRAASSRAAHERSAAPPPTAAASTPKATPAAEAAPAPSTRGATCRPQAGVTQAHADPDSSVRSATSRAQVGVSPAQASANPSKHAATGATPVDANGVQTNPVKQAAVSQPHASRPRREAPVAPSDRRTHIPRAAASAVLERDGLGCSWVSADGQRCGSTACLEIDHRIPAGKGSSSEPENLRLLCREHNRHTAEQVYGRAHMERAVAARRATSSATAPPPG